MDFADAVWAATQRLLDRAEGPVTDADVAAAMNQPLPVVRAVLGAAGDDGRDSTTGRPRVEQGRGKQPWTVHPAD